jgi:hypothetical protein
MRLGNSNSRKRRVTRKKGERPSRRGTKKRNQPTRSSRRLSTRQQVERLRVFAAFNRARRGEAKSATRAARAERTTVRAMQKLAPDALIQDRPGGRIRVKPTDRYSAKVQILTREGTLIATARGSRQRELAGRHRATYVRVLENKEPASALEQYRGKKVGGRELLSDYEQLRLFAGAGILGQLDTLYVNPDVVA